MDLKSGLKAIREESGIALRRFACYMGVKTSEARAWESGVLKLTPDILEKAGMILGCSVDYIYLRGINISALEEWQQEEVSDFADSFLHYGVKIQGPQMPSVVRKMVGDIPMRADSIFDTGIFSSLISKEQTASPMSIFGGLMSLQNNMSDDFFKSDQNEPMAMSPSVKRFGDLLRGDSK